jgi:hypothetical protein
MRVLVADPTAECGPRSIVIDDTDGVTTVDVEGARRRARLVLTHQPDRMRLALVDGTGVETDVTAAPGGGVAAAFAGAEHPAAADEVLAVLADRVDPGVDGHSLIPAQRLLAAAFPMLRQAAQRGTVIPTAVHAAAADVLRASTARDAVRRATADMRGGKRLDEAFLVALARATLDLRPVMALGFGRHLAVDDLVELMRSLSSTEPSASIAELATAHVAADAVRCLSRPRLKSVVFGLIELRDAPSRVRDLASAGRTGRLDVRDVRGRDIVAWVDDRVAEALNRPPSGMSVPVARAHGARLSDGGRIRVVRLAAEFDAVGRQLRNCLGTYGPHAVRRGAVILVVLGPDGEPRQALEVLGDEIVQWFGPGNSAVSATAADPVARALAPYGVRRPTRHPGTDPF